LVIFVVVSLFLVIFSDLLRLDDAHANAEETCATHEKLTRIRVLGDVGSAKGIARRPTYQLARSQLSTTTLHRLHITALRPAPLRLSISLVPGRWSRIITFFS